MKTCKPLIQVTTDQCIGCTRCMRVCPTEAIRIIDEKAHLSLDKCIYCGQCVQTCSVNAIKIQANEKHELNKAHYHVAILPIAIYGMIKNQEDLSVIYQTLYDLGFDAVMDLSPIYSVLSEKIARYVVEHEDNPYILTQCPAILKYIQLNYSSLVTKFLPFDFAYEIAARFIKEHGEKSLNVSKDQIKVSYITECLANLYAIKEPLGKSKSEVDYVFLLSTIFKDILKHLDSTVLRQLPIAKDGILWSKVGALRRTTTIRDYLSVDGISYVGNILEKVEFGQLDHIKILECYSCVSGCVGGTFTLENAFVAKTKVNGLYEMLEGAEPMICESLRKEEQPSLWEFEKSLQQFVQTSLDGDFITSLMKLQAINQLYEQLPKIDCCACGSPSCKALAEDVITGKKRFEDCVVLSKNGKQTN